MIKKMIILSVFWISSIPCFSQIYGVGHAGAGISACFVWEPFIIVPLNLLTFDGVCANGSVMLVWSAAKDPGQKYIIERSTDGMNFTVAGEVQVQVLQNDGQTHQYKFIDNHSIGGESYYRLKMEEADGHYVYSRTTKVSCGVDNAVSVHMYPNPTTGLLYVVTNLSKCSLVVRNLTGQEVLTRNSETISTTLDLSHFSPGLYLVEVHSPGKTVYQKIVLSRN